MYYFVIYGIEVWFFRKWYYGFNISVEIVIVFDILNFFNVKKLEFFLNRIFRFKNKERGLSINFLYMVV